MHSLAFGAVANSHSEELVSESLWSLAFGAVANFHCEELVSESLDLNEWD